jgi:hypothetical protein
MRLILKVLLVSLVCAPIAALVLVSLGLVVSKWKSSLCPWLARLAAPRFYLVSLPIATLIAGTEMLVLYSLLILHDLLSPVEFSSRYIFAELLNPIPFAYFLMVFTTELPFDLRFVDYAEIASLVGFWGATAISGYLLWLTVWLKGLRQPSSRIAGQRLRGLLLLICFAWAYIYLVTYIGFLVTPFGPSSQG